MDKFTNKAKEFFVSVKLTRWQSDVIRLINEKKDVETVKRNIDILITDKGFPPTLRHVIWKKLVGNKIRINKSLFQNLMEKALKSYTDDTLIKKDIDRTFSYFTKSESFTNVLAEAALLLEMFTLYRPDIKYIQGMSYVMTMLLLHYEPYIAFKVFCNLVLTKSFLYKTYLFKKKYIERIHRALEYIVSKNYPALYRYLRVNRLEIWNIFWIEWVYAMFLRTFDLRTCFILWDLILLKDDLFIFKLNYVVFGILDEHFQEINKNNFFESCRLILLQNQEKILMRVYHDTNHDFDVLYIRKIIHNLV